MSFIGLDEDLKVAARHELYPTIDPQAHYDAQTFAGKVVLITGASRGIGLEAALQYARAGASLVLVSREQATLDEAKAAILRERPTARVLTIPADVSDVKAGEQAVAAAVAEFGRLDVLVANAGLVLPTDAPFTTKDPESWWRVLEVNVRGPYNFIHFAVPELVKTKGRIIVTSSIAAQLRIPFSSQYAISKHAVGRLVEFVALEYPDVKVFALHPGIVDTELYVVSAAPIAADDPPALPAAVMLYISSGRADWLSGRYVSATWDLGEVERELKDKIVSQHLLVSKLAVP
ncbi:NAD-P-binding protein [Gloeopeniophorella convolvens]|nr:NAD-P-binding protein [Gloeopeniophorella convolvens]